MQVIPDAISMKINENSFLLNKEVLSIDLDSNSGTYSISDVVGQFFMYTEALALA